MSAACRDIEQPYHNEGAVEVQTLAAASGHHEPGPAVAVPQHGDNEEQQVEDAVSEQKQKLPTVILPVGSGQVPRGLMLVLVQIWRL